MNAPIRYTRQIILPEIGEEGQEKISSAFVLCIGAGGLGCPSLLYLSAAGVGHIGIVDFDIVEETNLQRQVLFTVGQIGQNKADAAKARLEALNPDIQVQSFPIELTAKNAENIFKEYDIIIDGTDNFAAKFLINDTAVKMGKPFIYGSALGFDGQLAVFNYEDGPCYRCLFPTVPTSHVKNCAESGIIGVVAGIIGTAQTMEALKIIIGSDSLQPLSNNLWTIDMRNMENYVLSISKNPDCPICANESKDIVLQYASTVFNQEVSVAQVKKTKDKILLIDVREDIEWSMGYIDGAKHIALSCLKVGKIPDLPMDREIVVYCCNGISSKQAIQIFKDYKYRNVHNLTGGYQAWINSF